MDAAAGSQGQNTWLDIAFAEQAQIQVQSLHPSIERHERGDPRQPQMSFVDLVAAIVILSNAVQGVSMLQLSRDLDCQYKTSFVLAHKLREAIASEIKGATLFGTVEVDGAYFGGHTRPANLEEDRVERRKAENKSDKRRIVGQHHHVSPQCLYQFANEAAWKEDHRRLSNGELSRRKLALQWRIRLAGCGLGTGKGLRPRMENRRCGSPLH